MLLNVQTCGMPGTLILLASPPTVPIILSVRWRLNILPWIAIFFQKWPTKTIKIATIIFLFSKSHLLHQCLNLSLRQCTWLVYSLHHIGPCQNILGSYIFSFTEPDHGHGQSTSEKLIAWIFEQEIVSGYW